VYQYGSRNPTATVLKKSLTCSWAPRFSIGINDVVIRKKWGGRGGLEIVVKEEVAVVAKGK
jgi:hypothetical protein